MGGETGGGFFYNDEVWMMMLGFPEDYKSERHIQNAVSDFGRVIL